MGIDRNCVVGMFTALLVLSSPMSEAYSGWREDVGVFKIGIVSSKNKLSAAKFVEPFRAALQEEISMPVKVFVAENYRTLINAQTNKKIHYAVHSASSFAATWSKCSCIEPLAAAKLSGGSIEYYSILIVKKDRISNIAELKGKRIAISGISSLSGYIIPKHELHDKELHFVDSPSEVGDTVIVSAGSAVNSRKLFQADLVDGLFGWSTMNGLVNSGYSAGSLVDLVNHHDMNMDDIRVIWKSKPIYAGPHTIASKVPDNIKMDISNFLLQLFEKNPQAYDSIENFKGGGFAKVELENYQPLIDFVAAKDDTPVPIENE